MGYGSYLTLSEEFSNISLASSGVNRIYFIQTRRNKTRKYKKLKLIQTKFMKEFEKHSTTLMNEFKKLHSASEPVIYYSDWTYKFFTQLLEKKLKKNDFKLESISPLNGDIPVILLDNSNDNIETDKKEKVRSSFIEMNRTGLFHLTFSEKSIKEDVVFCSFLNDINEEIHLLATIPDTFDKIKKLQKSEFAKQRKPDLGIFTGTVEKGVLFYTKYQDKISDKLISHPVKKDICEDIEYFFKNVERSVKNKEKGTRKVLIAGEQGTGKSSFINEIMLKYKSTHSILICTSLKEYVKHIELCGEYSVPCFAILEDCETHLDDRDGNMLNYLSGALEPKNAAGSFTIMTTNYPEKISSRIKNRPERIDEIYILSTLDEDAAMPVVEQYFSQFLPEGFNYESIKGVFKDVTGSEIMKYAADVKKAADYKHGHFDKIDAKFIRQVIKTQKNKYQKLSKINPNTTDLSKASSGFGNQVGFGNNYDEDYDN